MKRFTLSLRCGLVSNGLGFLCAWFCVVLIICMIYGADSMRLIVNAFLIGVPVLMALLMPLSVVTCRLYATKVGPQEIIFYKLSGFRSKLCWQEIRHASIKKHLGLKCLDVQTVGRKRQRVPLWHKEQGEFESWLADNLPHDHPLIIALRGHSLRADS